MLSCKSGERSKKDCSMTRLHARWRVITCAVVITGILILGIAIIAKRYIKRSRSIKIGILHSLTGRLSMTEKPIVDATLFAIDEINQAGGIQGRYIKPIVMDGKSDNEEFKKAALTLIKDEKVVALFGPWLSSHRAQLKEIVEKNDILLFYPAHDEGLEESENVIYMGSMPNQTIIPAITWCFLHLGKTFYFVGSDNLFPRVINEVVKLQIASLGGTLVGESYAEDEKQLPSIIENIHKLEPEVIIDALDSYMNIPFFKQLRAAGISSEKIPTMSFSFSELDLKHLNISSMIGDYTAWTYFDSIYREENIDFVKNFRKKFGAKREITSNMESAYNNIHLWANAVKEAKTTNTDRLRPYVKRQVYDAPGGIVYLSENQHAWRYAYIGKIRYDGSFDIIWNSGKQIKPLIYPPYKTKAAWEKFVQHLK